MDIFHAVILGIIEGITEFLPISSTGHLILSSKLLSLPETDFLKTFEISIQLGAILSVVVLYWKKLLVNFEIFKRIVLAFIPTGILGLAFYKIVKTYLMGNEFVVLASLFVGGVILILFEVWYSKKEILKQVQSLSSTRLGDDNEKSDDLEKISYKKSFFIGVFQSVAMIPGVSRSAATIIGGLSMGISRKTIVEFSFLLAVPTMMAATGLDLLKNVGSFDSNQFGALVVGFVISFFVALLSIKWLLNFIKNHSFVSFGIYRIIISVVLGFFILY